MPDFGKNGNEQDQNSENEEPAGGVRACLGHQHKARQTDENADDTLPGNRLLEEKEAGAHGHDGRRCDHQGADGRRFRKLDAVGFAEKVDEGFAKGEHEKLDPVLLADPDADPKDEIHHHQQHPCDENPEGEEVLHGNAQSQNPVTPDIGKPPKRDGRQGGQIDEDFRFHGANLA